MKILLKEQSLCQCICAVVKAEKESSNCYTKKETITHEK